MKKNLLLVLSFTLLISCNNKKDNLKSINDKDIIEYNDSLNIINETMINKDKIKEYFKNYIETDVDQDYYISEENVRLAMPIIYTSLKNNGFAFLDSARFYNRIDEIFSINENTKNPLIINHSNFYTYIDPNCGLSDPKDIALVEYLNSNNIYIIKV